MSTTAPPAQTARVWATVALLAVAAVAWVLTVDRMDGMDMGPGTDLGGLGWFAVGWGLMMTAMMVPSAAPAAVARTRTAVPFALGYIAVWTLAGLVAYALIEGVRSLDLGFLDWDAGGRYVAGGAIVGAALYQLTPLKRTCLDRCRSFSPPRGTELAGGVEYGVACLGCCWGMMAALFALGVMSITWTVVVAAMVAVEKLLPQRTVASTAVALVLLVLGLAVAFAPDQVPGLTVPDDTGSPSGMEMMG